MRKDRLLLLRPDFEDPAFPGQRFYCWHCALIEGVLGSFPDLALSVDIERIAWPRPRNEVIRWIGEDNQSLPVLLLAEGHRSPYETGRHDGLGFVADKDGILAVLAERHGFPLPHP